MIKSYYRIMAGAKSSMFTECRQDGFIGGDWGIDTDLTGKLPESWRDFNHQMVPPFLAHNPDKSKVAAGLAMGMLHTICKGIMIGDIVICPSGTGSYLVGEVTSEYFFVPGVVLPHRRKVKWYERSIERSEMSEGLRNSAGSIGTVANISKHAAELETLIAGAKPAQLTHSDENVEDPAIFALEKHLEDFLVANWAQTELGKEFDIYAEDGETIGRQYISDTGPIDILAISKTGNILLVVELKRGRASDVVVGQIQRYMGYVKDELAEPHQQVHGAIIALEDDLKLRRALSVTQNISFYRYQVSFKLTKHL